MIVVTCIVCGKEVNQTTVLGKLYCSRTCRDKQSSKHIFTQEFCREEQERRKQAYIDALSPNERKMHDKRSRIHKTFKIKHRDTSKGLMATRVCHNCGKPITNYRCPDCWLKIRGTDGLRKYGIETESIWDGF